MNRLILSLSVCISILMFISDAQAGLINYNRRNKAGTPPPTGGGYRAAPKVAPASAVKAPAAAQSAAPTWMLATPAVKNAVERVYDINRDGKLQPAEVKIYLRSVIETIEAKGGFTINSDVLKEYDKNRDGVVSRFELPELKRDAES